MVKRKARALTRSTKQTGSSDMARDRKRKALAPGKRRSKKGTIYYENRKNRSDVKGRDTPISRRKRIKRGVKANSAYGDKSIKKRKVVNKPVKTTIWKLIKSENGPYDTPYKVWQKGSKRISLWGLTDGKKDPSKRATKGNIRVVYKVGDKKYNTKIQAMSAVKMYMKTGRLPKATYNGRATRVNKSKPTREPLRGVRRHDLLPKSVRAKIPPLYSQDGKKDPKVYAKFFSPYSQYTFYITEFDGKDTMFGYVSNGQGSEWGYSSFKELVSANRRGLPLIERDMYFSPKPASKIKDIKRLKR